MRQFRIGSAFGIPIQVDLTFLLILPLFAWIIASQVDIWTNQFNLVFGGPLFDEAARETVTSGVNPWIIGIVGAIGLFAGVVLHELGHSVVALRYGFPIDSITLWIFGGIAQLSEMPEDWRQEFSIAIAGPIVSIAVGLLCAGIVLALGSGVVVIRFIFAYLALMNIVLAGFNLLPGFPMDGGRVLRALLARNRPFAQATKIAAEVGKVFAFGLGLLGLLQFNIILIGIAFFIYMGAAGEAQQTAMKAAFEGVSVRDIMTPMSEVTTVTPEDTITDLIDRMFHERHTGYPVVEHGQLVGLVTLEDAQSVKSVEQDAFTVRDVMSTDLTTVSADADAMDALLQMQEDDIGRLLVTDNGSFIGILTRSDIVTAFNIIKTGGEITGRQTDQRMRPSSSSNEIRFGG